ncbi:TetR/AcrR family transcriptional regulator [Gordonia rubripertincta]|uniref:TetR/AcrR family transcriptional regulator n=1 Tax=Gordonia rubripertincta TaxID=36822 RepID=UPI000B8DA88E|nr:TetR/AcrR family transcriptional regulator [Gordonia rubripertincta]ASR01766.1 DNA-binding transcriptional repressor AcrR [Gordonia rubripertincta]ASR05659.1 DNA-binding transcriptional repressor AcrR [Gordonia rubripertincta]
MSSDNRPLRADAERNRQAIICTAGRVFAEHGTGVTLERIAEEAGVGVGTIYRRFSSVQDLVGVVLEAKMGRYADRSEAAAEQALTQPWEAFRDYVLYILEQQAEDLGFNDVLMSPDSGTELFRAEMDRAFHASVVLVDRAQAAGAIRSDFDHSDLYLLTRANSGLLRTTDRSSSQPWRRLAGYMLQAFREPGAEPITPPSPAWTSGAGNEDEKR